MTFDEIFDEQARKNKLFITPDAIAKVAAVSIDDFDDEECKKIRSLHQELLNMAMKENESNEVGFLVNIIDWSYIPILGTEKGLTVRKTPQAKELLITAPSKSLLFLHNHPRNSIFSERDLNSFLTADAIFMVTVVCNNGKTYYLVKESEYNTDTALKYYDELFENDKIVSSVKEFLRTCRKVGLSFYYGGT